MPIFSILALRARAAGLAKLRELALRLLAGRAVRLVWMVVERYGLLLSRAWWLAPLCPSARKYRLWLDSLDFWGWDFSAVVMAVSTVADSKALIPLKS